MAKFEYINLQTVSRLCISGGGVLNYLKPVREINQHDTTTLFVATSSVQANRSNHIYPTTLDKVSIGSKFEEVMTCVDNTLSELKL
jgi:hypothetical protein